MTQETINGYPIQYQTITPARGAMRAGRIILVDRGGSMQSNPRYVTAWLGDGDNQWSGGHYIDNITDALTDYHERINREAIAADTLTN